MIDMRKRYLLLIAITATSHSVARADSELCLQYKMASSPKKSDIVECIDAMARRINSLEKAVTQLQYAEDDRFLSAKKLEIARCRADAAGLNSMLKSIGKPEIKINCGD